MINIIKQYYKGLENNMDLSFFNIFSDRYLYKSLDKDKRQELLTRKNSKGITEEDITMGSTAEITNNPLSFTQNLPDKRMKLMKYREMENFAEINEGLDYITDDAILEDANGDIVKLDLKCEMPPIIEKQLRTEFRYIVDDVFKARDNLWDLYRKWLVEGEIFLEIVKDDDNSRVVGVKSLASYLTFPVYSGSSIIGYIQLPESNTSSYMLPTDHQDRPLDFEASSVAYVNWGKYGMSRWDVRGFLEPVVRTYNQLKNLEDSIVVYRLSRSSEKRIWNIALGKMPSGKKQEQLRKMVHQYRKQMNYNSETGTIDSTAYIQSLSEDFWFAVGDNGEESKVTTLSAGMNLGEIEDLKYFLAKLYKVLKLPRNRFEDVNSVYSSGKSMEREEVRFGKFIDRTVNRFKKVIIDVYIEHLKSLGTIDARYIDRSFIDVHFTKANYFKEMKESELVQNALELWNTLSSHVKTANNPDGVFSLEYAWKYLMKLSDEDWHLNERLKKMEAIKMKEENPEGESEEL